MINPHSAASFAQFFDNKVADIRAKTANAPPPTIVSRDLAPLATFRPNYFVKGATEVL